MLDEGCIQFAAQLAQEGQAPPPPWTHPQLVTRELLADCKGPDAEWLVQNSSSGGSCGTGGPGSILADGRGLPAVAEEQPSDSEDEPLPSLAAPEAAGGDVEGGLPAAHQPGGPSEHQPQQLGQDAEAALGEQEEAASGSGPPSWRESEGGLSTLFSSPEGPELADAPAFPDAGGMPAAGLDTSQEASSSDGAPAAAGGPGGFSTPFKNPVFVELEACEPGSPSGSATPAGSAVQALITPGGGLLDGSGAQRPARQLGGALSLEAQLEQLAGGSAADTVGPSPAEAAALQQLQARLAAADVEAAQLREDKSAAEVRAAALLDEVQLCFAALEGSQAARRQAELQQAQVASALQAALGEQATLAAALEAGRQEAAALQERIGVLEYQKELMQVERQEAAAQPYSTLAATADTHLDLAAGGQLAAECATLRAALAEANHGKAVLASKLQLCRADNAQLAARLQGSQARHAADLAAAEAAARDCAAQAAAGVAQMRAENHQLVAQVEMLQRTAAAAGESQRSAALSGILRQREEQLTQAHLEVAQLQARVRELLAAEERCTALEGRVAMLLRQHESLADRLQAAQGESSSWRSALGRLSDELAAVSAREAAARSALRDTADKMLVQQQLGEAQAEELELLRAQVTRLTHGQGASQRASAPRGLATDAGPTPHPQQQEGHPPAAQQPLPQLPLQQGVEAVAVAPRSVASSEGDDGSPRGRRAGGGKAAGFSWGRMFKGA